MPTRNEDSDGSTARLVGVVHRIVWNDATELADLRRAVADRLRRGGVPLDAYCTYMSHAAITGLKHYVTVDGGDLVARSSPRPGSRRCDRHRGSDSDRPPRLMQARRDLAVFTASQVCTSDLPQSPVTQEPETK